jgi:hypothetical protein
MELIGTRSDGFYASDCNKNFEMKEICQLTIFSVHWEKYRHYSVSLVNTFVQLAEYSSGTASLQRGAGIATDYGLDG